jgi:TIGR04076 family protein
MSKQVKITVLKRLLIDDVIDKYAGKKIEPCARCKEGDVYITDGRSVPKGFCVWAWSDIFKDILMVRSNAECGSADKKCQVASCTDGFRPVIFLIEPCEE